MAKITNSQPFRITNSYLNLIVGIIVVVAIGALVIGLIRGRGLQQPEEAKEEAAVTEEAISLPTKHTVTAGEDLWKISEKYYKTGYNWVDIAKENNLSNPNTIAAGIELAIPNVPPKVLSTPEPAKPAPLQALGEPITGDSYTVVAGDNLWNIALRAYGDGFKWVDITSANSLANPNLIHKGNVFRIPR